MKVLWFTNTPSRYASGGGYNGGGWIYSLEEEMSLRAGIQLAVSFFMDGQPEKIEKNGVTYYPIGKPTRLTDRIKRKLEAAQKRDEEQLGRMLDIIQDFQPDVIEVFGSEMSFGKVAKLTRIPVVLHIQGILTPYYNAFLPPFISEHNYIWQDKNPRGAYRRWKAMSDFFERARREVDIIRHIHYFIGRTEWDKRLTLLYNPTACYFYGSEILRKKFYQYAERHLPERAKIVSTLSAPLYKGYDTILRTAKLLTDEVSLDFEWLIYGGIDPKFMERKVGIKHDDVSVRFMGIATAEELQKELSTSTVYVHLSYIDNSPNSLCEAQITGVPVVATNVGGIPSLVTDGETGFLVPANDPYQTAYIINRLAKDKSLNEEIGNKAYKVAINRHDRAKIVEELIRTYTSIVNNESK